MAGEGGGAEQVGWLNFEYVGVTRVNIVSKLDTQIFSTLKHRIVRKSEDKLLQDFIMNSTAIVNCSTI